jgi:cephalosporin-C deacetylase-like acetyl esterase
MPGVSEADIHLVDDTGVVIWTDRMRFMYDWPSYRPAYHAPADLREFWDGTLGELSQIPLDPRVEKTLFRDDPDWTFEHVSFAGWQGQRIHACVFIPKTTPKPLPVAISAHPGALGFGANHRADGVYGSQVKHDPRFVTILPLIRGHEPDAENIPFNQPWWGPLDRRDDYAARAWYCAMVRALDYLATRPDLADMSKVVSKGGSQGGALALVTAALDARVTLCIADSPSNCMHHDAVRPATYPSFGPAAGQVPAGQTLEDLLRMLSYFDPAHLAPWIRCPTVIHLTVGDLTVHSMGGLGVYKNLTGLDESRKWFLPGVNGHYHAGSAAGGAKARELIDELVGPAETRE